MKLFSKISYSVFAFLLLFSASLFAAEATQKASVTINRDDPEQMVKQATDALLAIAKKAKTYVDKDKPRYYREGEAILDQVIDREYFARGVMATYASARQYNALKTDAEKQAFRERVNHFADIMEQVLIEKYADALLLFDGQRIEIDGVDPVGTTGKNVNVRQLIYDKDNKVYTVQYNLHKDDQGKWLLYNVVVEGVNLASVFRGQFADAVEKNRGDVDYVINHWNEILSQGEQQSGE